MVNLFCQHLKEAGIADDHIIKVDLEDRRNKDPGKSLHPQDWKSQSHPFLHPGGYL